MCEQLVIAIWLNIDLHVPCMRNELVSDFRRAKLSYIFSLSQSASLLKFIRSLSRPISAIPDFVIGGEVISDDGKKAIVLNNYFSRVDVAFMRQLVLWVVVF